METHPQRTPDPFADNGERLDFVAYDLLPSEHLPELVPAKRAREWMVKTDQSFANRCLALLMANQNGWWLLNREAFSATWDGGKDASAITFEWDVPKGVRDHSVGAGSRFGYGILSWHVPYLFRTPPGWNLVTKGPANMPKDGIGPLEGLIEADWADVTFTMNWKFTRADHPVRFEEGEPFAMLTPHQRGAVEAMDTERKSIAEAPESLERMRSWALRRQEQDKRAFLASYFPEAKAMKVDWDGAYMRGDRDGSSPFDGHQRVMDVKAFDRSADVG